MTPTATYLAEENCLQLLPQKPEPSEWQYYVAAVRANAFKVNLTKNEKQDIDDYNAHLATLRKIPCSPEPGFKDGQKYTEGVDYEIKGADDWKWCYQLKGNIFAAPIVPVKSEDGWLSVKPEFKEECAFASAHWWKDHWEYKIWEIKKIDSEEGWYYGLCEGDGEEWGTIEELAADKYFILPKPITH